MVRIYNVALKEVRSRVSICYLLFPKNVLYSFNRLYLRLYCKFPKLLTRYATKQIMHHLLHWTAVYCTSQHDTRYDALHVFVVQFFVLAYLALTYRDLFILVDSLMSCYVVLYML